MHAVELEKQKQAVANAKMLVDTYEGEEGCEKERKAAKRELRALLQASLLSMPQLPQAAPQRSLLDEGGVPRCGVVVVFVPH